MKTFIRRIVDTLDGAPVVRGQMNKGQSVLELALVTPILIILIVGIVEIGWFANNYLILLEVTRVGARRGAVLTGDNVPQLPIEWNGQNLTIAASVAERGLDPDDPTNALNDARFFDVRDCGNIGNAYVGFYNLVLCQMVNSLDPLTIRFDPLDPLALPEEERTDDIIISVFAVQMVENGPGGDYDFTSAAYKDPRPTKPENNDPDLDYEYGIQGWLPVVVGRFPVNANECTAFEVLGGPTAVAWDNTTSGTVLERDPFDYVHDDDLTTFPLDWTGVDGVTIDGSGNAFAPDGRLLPRDYPIELYVANPAGGWLPVGLDTGLEAQRGFSYTGFHRVESDTIQVTDATGTYQARLECYGSNWTIYDVQELIRGDNFILSADELADMRAVDPDFGKDEFGNDIDTREFFANVGVVLVEVYWRHELLLDMPVFSPVFNALGGDQTTIYVWSAFPTPAASPNLQYNLGPLNFYTPAS